MISQALKHLLKSRLSAQHRAVLHGWRERIRNAGELIANLGFRYRCPFCRWSFRRFLPSGLDLPVFRAQNVIGAGRRENAICPRCWSSDRERHLLLFLNNCTPLFSDRLRVLHVAPERNLQPVLRRLPNLDYLSADLCSPRAMVRMDVTNIPFPDDSFDVVLCNHVLEHIPDERRARDELYRVLKPCGWAVLQVPICTSLERTFEDDSITTRAGREQAFGQYDHVRLHGLDYRDRLESAGFRVELKRWRGDSPGRDYGLIADEDIYLCRKPAAVQEAGRSPVAELARS